jgi:hypothetical protein
MNNEKIIAITYDSDVEIVIKQKDEWLISGEVLLYNSSFLLELKPVNELKSIVTYKKITCTNIRGEKRELYCYRSLEYPLEFIWSVKIEEKGIKIQLIECLWRNEKNHLANLTTECHEQIKATERSLLAELHARNELRMPLLLGQIEIKKLYINLIKS